MNRDLLLTECDFSAVRSSGPGGQHVNKTSSKVVLHWDLDSSQIFDKGQKEYLRQRLATRLTKANVLQLTNEQGRSQHKNKEAVIAHFFKVLEDGLKRPKKRKKTRVPRVAKLKRLRSKKHRAERKSSRKPPEF